MSENIQGTTTSEAKEKASEVAQDAVQAGGQIAQETGRQARNLMSEAQSQIRDQASTQQRKAAEGLHSLGHELRLMADKADHGTASGLVEQASQRVHQVAEWLDHREPGQLLDEVREFARRHPGAFLAGAAALGAVAGRLTRTIAAESGQDGGSTRPVAQYPTNDTLAYPTGDPVVASSRPEALP